jgi:hypothetical protein
VKNQVPEIFRDIALEEKAGYSISEQFPLICKYYPVSGKNKAVWPFFFGLFQILSQFLR